MQTDSSWAGTLWSASQYLHLSSGGRRNFRSKFAATTQNVLRYLHQLAVLSLKGLSCIPQLSLPYAMLKCSQSLNYLLTQPGYFDACSMARFIQEGKAEPYDKLNHRGSPSGHQHSTRYHFSSPVWGWGDPDIRPKVFSLIAAESSGRSRQVTHSRQIQESRRNKKKPEYPLCTTAQREQRTFQQQNPKSLQEVPSTSLADNVSPSW